MNSPAAATLPAGSRRYYTSAGTNFERHFDSASWFTCKSHTPWDWERAGEGNRKAAALNSWLLRASRYTCSAVPAALRSAACAWCSCTCCAPWGEGLRRPAWQPAFRAGVVSCTCTRCAPGARPLPPGLPQLTASLNRRQQQPLRLHGSGGETQLSAEHSSVLSMARCRVLLCPQLCSGLTPWTAGTERKRGQGHGGEGTSAGGAAADAAPERSCHAGALSVRNSSFPQQLQPPHAFEFGLVTLHCHGQPSSVQPCRHWQCSRPPPAGPEAEWVWQRGVNHLRGQQSGSRYAASPALCIHASD